ncbi:unnamed protein product [Urochloa decumbens]|uniref:F-box domain-containing protein n=1 Tax=Urochloa decumbens TaxID=240449 RepID=A0ABC9D7B5_9POAL
MASAAAAGLTDDLIVDILSRLPVKSLCQCKCVSPHWRDLISHPDHRRRLPQTLAGFFGRVRTNDGGVWRFTSLFDARQPPLACDAPFSFMAGDEDVAVLDACNGRMLCRTPKGLTHHVSRYAVCNPATKSWVALPASSNQGGNDDEDEDNESAVVRLGFDPAVSQDFYVFVFVKDDAKIVAGVEIYSSKTEAWSYKESRWNSATDLFEDSPSIFLNGLLHFTIHYHVVSVDVEGESWLLLPALEDVDDLTVYDPGFLGQYQGHLCYMNLCADETHLSIWVLEDYHANEWVLKHRITIQELTENICPPKINYFGQVTIQQLPEIPEAKYFRLITVHPDCNWILYVCGREEDTLMAYDMDKNEARVIQNLGSCTVLLPYVPFYAKSLTDGHGLSHIAL